MRTGSRPLLAALSGLALLSACAAPPPAGGPPAGNLYANQLAELDAKIARGDIELNCDEACLDRWKSSYPKIREEYYNERWTSLSRSVARIGFDHDLGWFLLAQAAEAMKNPVAAERYRSRATALWEHGEAWQNCSKIGPRLCGGTILATLPGKSAPDITPPDAPAPPLPEPYRSEPLSALRAAWRVIPVCDWSPSSAAGASRQGLLTTKSYQLERLRGAAALLRDPAASRASPPVEAPAALLRSWDGPLGLRVPTGTQEKVLRPPVHGWINRSDLTQILILGETVGTTPDFVEIFEGEGNAGGMVTIPITGRQQVGDHNGRTRDILSVLAHIRQPAKISFSRAGADPELKALLNRLFVKDSASDATRPLLGFRPLGPSAPSPLPPSCEPHQAFAVQELWLPYDPNYMEIVLHVDADKAKRLLGILYILSNQRFDRGEMRDRLTAALPEISRSVLLAADLKSSVQRATGISLETDILAFTIDELFGGLIESRAALQQRIKVVMGHFESIIEQNYAEIIENRPIWFPVSALP